MRKDYIYIIVTVLKTKNTYEMRMRKPTLKSNQMAYCIKIELDEEKWFDRVYELKEPLPEIKPPQMSDISLSQVAVGRSVEEHAVDRIMGRQPEKANHEQTVNRSLEIKE